MAFDAGEKVGHGPLENLSEENLVNRLPTLILVLIAVLMAAAGCRSASFPAAAAVEPPVPTLTVQVQPSATEARQPSATLAPAATAITTVPPAPAAQLEPTPAVTPHGDSSLPEPCRPSNGNRVYTRSEDAFCFSMPERFEVETSSPGYAADRGPRAGAERRSHPGHVGNHGPGCPARQHAERAVDEALAEFADFTAWESSVYRSRSAASRRSSSSRSPVCSAAARSTSCTTAPSTGCPSGR